MTEGSLLDHILAPEGLSPRFQPILEANGADWDLHAVECLMRGPSDTNIESADILFEYARRKRAESIVDRACIAAALKAASQLEGIPRFFLNVHASTLGRDADFARFIADTAADHAIVPSRLTLEIVERQPYWNGPRFMATLDRLRIMGIKIALDDFGLGESNYRMMLDCWPDCIKVDRYVVRNCDSDYGRRAILDSIANLALTIGSKVIAEGVQTRAELKAIKDLGFTLAQGFVLYRPMTLAEMRESSLLESASARAATPTARVEAQTAPLPRSKYRVQARRAVAD
jgi:EAL domain-containing protein (putative c-di-GMP-specific phosphodiesterase class I)